MKTLQEAVQDYLAMRRALGFQLLHAGPALTDFVSFLQRKRTSHITIRMALKTDAQPLNPQHGPIDWHWFAVLPGTEVLLILERRFPRKGCCRFDRNRRLRTCTQTMKCDRS